MINISFEVNPQTTEESLKLQYKKLSKVLHPDTGGNEEDFKSLNIAYKAALNKLRLKAFDEPKNGSTDTLNKGFELPEIWKTIYQKGGKGFVEVLILQIKDTKLRNAAKIALEEFEKLNDLKP